MIPYAQFLGGPGGHPIYVSHAFGILGTGQVLFLFTTEMYENIGVADDLYLLRAISHLQLTD